MHVVKIVLLDWRSFKQDNNIVNHLLCYNIYIYIMLYLYDQNARSRYIVSPSVIIQFV